jgi:tyrosine-specific transport protein
MDRNVKKVRLSIFVGSAIPLVVYLVWELIILGIIPVDRLVAAKADGQTAIMPLKEILGNPLIYQIGSWFAFFVLTTSYIAIALAFFDFLADGLHIKKEGWKKVGLCMAIFIPPTIIALIYPHIFLISLDYAGGISCAFLFGLLPPLMVWVGRYVKKWERDEQVPGGKLLLVPLFVFVIVEMISTVYNVL